MSLLFSASSQQRASGGLAARSGTSTLTAAFAYRVTRWTWDVEASYGRARAQTLQGRSFAYLQAGIHYELAADARGWTLGLVGYNLTGESRARVVAFAPPFLHDGRTGAVPATVGVQARCPLRARLSGRGGG